MPKHKSVIDQAVVKDQVERAAAAMSILPIEWWSQWIVFFLEALETHSGDRADRFDLVLTVVAKDIETRQTEGRW